MFYIPSLFHFLLFFLDVISSHPFSFSGDLLFTFGDFTLYLSLFSTSSYSLSHTYILLYYMVYIYISLCSSSIGVASTVSPFWYNNALSYFPMGWIINLVLCLLPTPSFLPAFLIIFYWFIITCDDYSSLSTIPTDIHPFWSTHLPLFFHLCYLPLPPLPCYPPFLLLQCSFPSPNFSLPMTTVYLYPAGHNYGTLLFFIKIPFSLLLLFFSIFGNPVPYLTSLLLLCLFGCIFRIYSIFCFSPLLIISSSVSITVTLPVQYHDPLFF